MSVPAPISTDNAGFVWATTVIFAALISAAGGIIVARMSRKIAEIHVMVNSNLDAARQERATAIQALAQLNVTHAQIVADAAAKAAKESLSTILAQYDLVKRGLAQEGKL